LVRRLATEKTLNYYDESAFKLDGNVLKSPNTVNGRNIEYTAFVFDRNNKTLNMISEYVANMHPHSPESSLTAFEPTDRFTTGLTKGMDVVNGLANISDSIKATVELNTYKIVLTTQDGKDPRITVHKPNLSDFGTNKSSSLFGDSPIRSGITYTALPEDEGTEIFLRILRKD